MRLPIHPIARVSLLGAATLISGCSDHGGPVGPPTNIPGITAVMGANVTDTVLARIAAPLVVEARDSSGALLSGVVVRFDADVVTTPGGGQALSVALSSAIDNAYPWDASSYSTTTDERGRAAVRLAMGTVAGDVSVKVSVPTFGFSSRIHLTVLPGNAARVAIYPADTAINVGGTATVRSMVTDRFGNPRTEPVTLAFHGPAISGENSTARGAAYGVAHVVGISGTLIDSSRVVVLPKATLAAVSSYQSDGLPLVVFNSDGTGRHGISVVPGYAAVAFPYWAPSGDRLVCVVGSAIYSVPVAGGNATVIGSGSWPQYTRDGAWVYYSSNSRIWRVKPDGSAATQVTPDDNPYALDQIASPDPTGSRLVMWTSRTSSPIAIFDTATRTVTPTAGSGGYARWSPRGDRIAVADWDGLSILDASGALVTKFQNVGEFWASPAPLDWSPDGEWIVASGSGTLEMIEVATRRVLPIPGTAGYANPTWKH